MSGATIDRVMPGAVRSLLVLVLVLIAASGCGEDDFGDEPIAPEILVAMSERHFDGTRSYDLVVHQDSTAVLSTRIDQRESWTITPDTRQAIISALVDGGFARMKREYLDAEATCGGLLLVSLNDGRFRKTVRADDQDPRSEDAWRTAGRVKELLGLDAIRDRLRQR